MDIQHRQSSFWGPFWKISLIAVVYFVVKAASWALVSSAGLPLPDDHGHSYNQLLGFLSAVVFAACLFLLAMGIGGSRSKRWLILLVFTYVSFVINNQIEGAVFTSSVEIPTMLLFFVLPCVAASGAAVLLIRPPGEKPPLTTVFSDRPVGSWWWRLVIAWFAFPVIYYFFGALIYPLVADVYAQEDSGLRVPGQLVILGAVTIRSLLFLVVTIPVIRAWRGSRKFLILSLAAAFSAMVGVAGLIESTWMPLQLRVVHSLEIIADSLVHAWVLVALLVSKARDSADQHVAAVTM